MSYSPKLAFAAKKALDAQRRLYGARQGVQRAENGLQRAKDLQGTALSDYLTACKKLDELIAEEHTEDE